MSEQSEDESHVDPRSQAHPRRLMWDGTINAGHVLTSLSMIALVFASYSNLDKRVTIVERDIAYQQQRDSLQDEKLRDAIRDLQSSVIDLRRVVEKINDRQTLNPPTR